MHQAEQNVERWKKRQSDQAWFNQFAESAKQQEQQRQTKQSVNPWKKSLPSTFHWSPEIAEVIKKRDQWDDINAMANSEFQTSVSKTFGGLPPSDASLASHLQKRKTKANTYPLQMKSICTPVIISAYPSQDFGLKTKQLLLIM